MTKSISSWSRWTQVQVLVAQLNSQVAGLSPFLSEVGTAAALASQSLAARAGLVSAKHLARCPGWGC